MTFLSMSGSMYEKVTQSCDHDLTDSFISEGPRFLRRKRTGHPSVYLSFLPNHCETSPSLSAKNDRRQEHLRFLGNTHDFLSEQKRQHAHSLSHSTKIDRLDLTASLLSRIVDVEHRNHWSGEGYTFSIQQPYCCS